MPYDWDATWARVADKLIEKATGEDFIYELVGEGVLMEEDFVFGFFRRSVESKLKEAFYARKENTA